MPGCTSLVAIEQWGSGSCWLVVVGFVVADDAKAFHAVADLAQVEPKQCSGCGAVELDLVECAQEQGFFVGGDEVVELAGEGDFFGK